MSTETNRKNNRDVKFATRLPSPSHPPPDLKRSPDSPQSTGIPPFDFPFKSLFIDLFQYNVYLVGGTVRDLLMYGHLGANHDYDLVICGHDYDAVTAALAPHGKIHRVGKSFQVVKFTIRDITFDVSVPRHYAEPPQEKEQTYDLLDDLNARDFTCNAMALRLADNQLVDPLSGKAAVETKILRVTHADSLHLDPLRLLRAARFASVHHLTIPPELYLQSKEVSLENISVERVSQEFCRLLLESKRPSIGLNEYWRLSVLQKRFPSIYAMTLTMQDALFHPETDEFGHHTVWAHTLIAMDIARNLAREFKLSEEETLTLLLGALLHDIAKPNTTRWEFKRGRMTITSIFHDTQGVPMADQFLKELQIENRNHFPVRRTVLNLIKNHHRIFELYRNRDKIGFKAFSRMVRDMEGRDFLLLLLDYADRQSREPDPFGFNDTDEIFNWYCRSKKEFELDRQSIEPILLGRHLLEQGLTPGKQLGVYLKEMYEKQLDGEFKTLQEGIALFHRLKEQGKLTITTNRAEGTETDKPYPPKKDNHD